MGSDGIRSYQRDDDYGGASRQQRETDKSQLGTLSLIYFILAILNTLSLVMLLLGVLIVGGVLIAVGAGGGTDAPPIWVGIVVIVGGLIVSLLPATITYLMYKTASSLKEHRRPTLCFVMAIFLCVTGGILGIILGIFTIIVLRRPSVQELFARSATA
jgi:hypothetical protein